MFAPIVLMLKQAIGKKEFGKLRGKVIALHSKVITAFCNRFNLDKNSRKKLIIMAKNNGKALGLMA